MPQIIFWASPVMKSLASRVRPRSSPGFFKGGHHRNTGRAYGKVSFTVAVMQCHRAYGRCPSPWLYAMSQCLWQVSFTVAVMQCHRAYGRCPSPWLYAMSQGPMASVLHRGCHAMSQGLWQVSFTVDVMQCSQGLWQVSFTVAVMQCHMAYGRCPSPWPSCNVTGPMAGVLHSDWVFVSFFFLFTDL
ncbi:hypothetical protein Btru_044766 [Bulinus truncatus]|nr:hypothetical protein Btru_044766 [Bulinus truncatus]